MIMAFTPSLPTIIVLASLALSSSAQVVYRRRRSSLSRIIAGVVVGALALIFFLCLLMLLMRRRRQRQTYAVTTTPGGGPPQPSWATKPMFGGPWGRPNAGIPPHSGPPMSPYGQPGSFSPNNIVNYPQQQHHAQGSNPEYPPQNAPIPPPAYGQGANHGGSYEAPQGTPQGQPSNLYAPPPGPPPPAVTKGNEPSFVGGFRS